MNQEFNKKVKEGVDGLLEDNKESLGMVMPIIQLAKIELIKTLQKDPKIVRDWLINFNEKLEACLEVYEDKE